MRIAFAGTPEFAALQLQALIDAACDIVVVYTQPDKPQGRGQQLQESEVKQCAKKHHIPIEQPTTLKNDAALTTLQHYQPDVMIVAAYGLLLPQAFLDIPKYGCINVHASLLPKYRGASPIQQAILNGDKQTGITLMRMQAGLDTGPILTQDACVIEASDTTQTLHDKLARLGQTMLTRDLAQIAAEPGTPQDEQQATHAKKISKQEALIDWQESAEIIERKIRAYTPWPIAHTQIEGTVVRVYQAQIVRNTSQATPGTIIDIQSQGIVVKAGKNALLITSAQLPGKKVMAFSDILAGHRALFATDKRFAS